MLLPPIFHYNTYFIVYVKTIVSQTQKFLCQRKAAEGLFEHSPPVCDPLVHRFPIDDTLAGIQLLYDIKPDKNNKAEDENVPKPEEQINNSKKQPADHADRFAFVIIP